MSFELNEEQLREYFERGVLPYVEDLRAQGTDDLSGPPVLVYVGAQPGAGKSRAVERVTQSRPTLVSVIGDDLRQFHPDYKRLMREDPLAMPAATAQASGRWIGMAAEYLREQRADVLIETTLRSPGAMADTISSFREAGYAVELRTLAVPHEVSRLSTVERYTGQVEDSGVGRWTPAAAHDEAFEKAPETVRALIAAGSVDRFTIENRAGGSVFDKNYFEMSDEALQTAGRDAAVAFAQARDITALSPQEAASWVDLAQVQTKLVPRLSRQDPDLLATVERIGTIDARAVAARAYPADPSRVSAATEALHAAPAWTQPTTPAVAEEAPPRASSPQAAVRSAAQPPQVGPQRGARTRRSGPYTTGRGGSGLGR